MCVIWGQRVKDDGHIEFYKNRHISETALPIQAKLQNSIVQSISINHCDYHVIVSKVKVMPGDSILIMPLCACV